jgi:rhamnulokinase
MTTKTVLAVDLGAESGRVMAVGFDGRHLNVEELHRFPNTSVMVNGTLTWDFLRLWGDIQTGIGRGMEHTPAGISVDTWGVDFGLLDRRGDLLGNPVHYRDSRTEGVMARTLDRVGRERVYAETGIQFMEINTIFQLMSLVEQDSPQLAVADTLLTSPDLLNYWLTGAKVSERTIASTTQLLRPDGTWATGLMADLGIPQHIFPEVVEPGVSLGDFRGIPVFTSGCHDTANAVAAVPMTTANPAYISSGTWSLIGLEMDRAILTPAALAANVTNEAGVYGTYTLLHNVTGMWILQQCRAAWAKEGDRYSYAELTELAEEAPPLPSVIDPGHASFMPPGDHRKRVQAYCRETGQPVPESVGEIVATVLAGLAHSYRTVLDRLAALTGRTVDAVHIVGGGSQNDLLNQMTADATGLPVLAGPVEATVLGNALVQLIALGEIADLAQARQIVGDMGGIRRFEPR